MVSAISGGVLIALAAGLLLLFNGRIAGISGIYHGIFAPRTGDRAWRLLFVIGLLCGGAVVGIVDPSRLPSTHQLSGVREWSSLVLAGILVGLGTRVANGCASGHGVCGVGRLSTRSMVATLTFLVAGMGTVAIVALLDGGRL